MTLRHLKIFVTVCEEGGITRAGEKLFIAQPTVSLAISELEKYYGNKLFDRISKKMHLTDAGKKLLPYAQHITAMFDELETEVKAWKKTGTIHIGCSITIGNFLMPDMIKAFKKSNQDIEIKVMINNSDIVEKAVFDNQIDLGLIEGTTRNSQVISKKFGEDELMLICSPTHKWKDRKSVTIEDVANEPLLMREKGSGGRELFESVLMLHGITIKPLWESVSTQALVRAVENDFGVSVLPFHLIEKELKEKSILAKSIENAVLKRNYSIIYHKNKYLTEPAKEFIKLCIARYTSSANSI